MLRFAHAVAQEGDNIEINRQADFYLRNQQHALRFGDTLYLIRGNCKNNMALRFIKPEYIKYKKPVVNKTQMLKVSGNILYNFSYQSYIDTPFAQPDMMQHLMQTNLHFLVKEKYPFAVIISRRSSNSPYFRDYTDVNVQFDQRQLLNNIKGELNEKVPRMVNRQPLLNAMRILTNLQNEVSQLQQWLKNPARAQEFVEEKERQLRNGINHSIGSLPSDLPGANLTRQNALGSPTAQSKDSASASTDKLLAGLIHQFKFPPLANYKFNSTETKNKLKEVAEKKMDSGVTHVASDSSYVEQYNAKKKKLDSLQQKLKKVTATVKLLNNGIQDSIKKVKTEINALKTDEGLYAFMKKNNLSKDSLTKAQRLLLSVKKVGLGRSWIDYSELTVKNVSLTGANVEVTPGHFYFALAAGKLNYRFRDFVFNNNRNAPGQQLLAARAGIGSIEKNNIITTFYTGSKALLNSTPGATNSGVQKIAGLSIEAKMIINENNYLVAEIAKSTFGLNSSSTSTSGTSINKLFDLKNNTNTAYSIKLFSQNPATDTKLTAYYKKLGENFQSFNLYPININQDAWMVRVTQRLWHKWLTLDAAVRKNDFVSPIAVQSISSSTVFKSIQATLKVPKYPFVSVGYFPASQLSVSGGNTLLESHYNTFNSIISHNYQVKKISMNSNAVFTKFFNNSSDTGFIYYNASSFTFNQSVFLFPLTIQTSISTTARRQLNLLTVQQQLGCQLNRFFSVNAGLKWNRLNHTETMYGATASLVLNLKRVGSFQLNYDKTYLPFSSSTKLVPVDIGRMSFYKEF